MRRKSSNCASSYCAPPLCYLPCLPKKSKDDAVRDPEPVSPSPAPAAAVVEDKPPVVQKMEQSAPAPAPAPAPAAAAAATGAGGGGGVDDGDDGKCYKEVAVAPKSCLKRADCEEDSSSSKKSTAAKGNVKWRDLLGKDLTQVKEFEPSESGDSDDEEYGGACACVVQ